jgi:hypothetical protein
MEITGLGSEAVTLDDTSIAASALNALDVLTSGTIAASSVTTLTGAAAAVGPRQANTTKFTYTDGTTEVANWNGTRTESAPKVLQSIKVRKA